MTGKEIYEKESWGDPGPGACTNCHGDYSDEDNPDYSRFKVLQFEGGVRTTDDWLDTRSVAEQERMVAFGVHGVRPDGVAYRNMAPYKNQLSRAEIARVVKYVRTLKPLLATIKTEDP